MPHSLILCMGSTVDAVKAYDEVLDPRFKRVALIDTFLDEKFETLNVARALGERLYAVRFDTPGSRRGNFYRILEETRWELDLRGYKHVKFFVSGGINESDMPELNRIVDGYGVGTSISNAPVVDFAMDIVEVDGKPLAKRGKWSGSKRVIACGRCGERKVIPNDSYGSTCSCGGMFNDLVIPALDHGQQLMNIERPAQVRQGVLERVKDLDL
jgi:nicotinate phosphoribosyltransferase